ncbi:MAG: glucokinase [Candidatus Hepatoplasma vulgare]|nr:MAG: glucokinase [Candidatus Hepatoplasma sp.]
MINTKNKDNKELLLAVDIGGTFIKLAIITREGLMLDRWRIKTNTNEKGKYIPEEITNQFKNKLNEEKYQNKKAIAMGIGIPGFPALDGTVKFSGNIGWKNYDVKKDLKKWWNDLPIAVHNDCDMAALGEKFVGNFKKVDNFVFITLGTGMGAGILINGKLYQGSGGTAGEIGHIPIQGFKTRFQCTCGLPECAEPTFSATGLINIYNEFRSKNSNIKSILDDKEINGKNIWDAVRENDKLAIMAAKEFGEYGGRLLATVAMSYNPEVIILGGGLAHDNETILEYVIPVYKKFTHDFIRETTRVELCSVGNDAGLYGASYSAMILYDQNMLNFVNHYYATKNESVL